MAKISSRSLLCAQKIGAREPFETYGALYAKTGRPYSHGWLTGADLDAYHRDHANITYVVISYNTPIAWVTSDGSVHRVAQKFSVTTSKHQGKTYLL